MGAKQTPLIDLLERVPQDARVVVEHDQFSSRSPPVVRLCHEAAAELRRLHAEVESLRIALEQQAQPVYRCHIDLEEGMEPDDCVLDSGRRDDCFYARLHGDRARERCGEWKPIQIAKHQPQCEDTIAALRERQAAR